MQGAAPAALISKNANPAKTSGKHGVQAHAKTAFQAILGSKAAAMKKGGLNDTAATKAAATTAVSAKVAVAKAAAAKTSVLKALAKNAASESAKTHADGMAAALAKKTAAAGLGKQHILEGQPLAQHLAAANAASQAEDQKKKTAKTQHHTDEMAQAVSLTASSQPGIKNMPKPEPAKAPATGQAAAIHAAPPHKTPELRVHVVDARKKHSDQRADDASADLKALKIAATEKDAANPVVVVKDPPAPDSGPREAHRQGPAPQASFEGAIQHLREMAGSELTRAAGIIIRDGGGEIKLTLKPESLGSVRIRMNLVDNAIEGRIIVDNAAVKHVFEGSLDSLMRALTAEGFQTASLQVSVGGQNAGGGRPDKEPLPRSQRVEPLRAVAGDWNVPGVENLSMGDLLVNLFV
ncbi:MAG: flagellar hook-length control protein FliK [Spirochaetia bacterium]